MSEYLNKVFKKNPEINYEKRDSRIVLWIPCPGTQEKRYFYALQGNVSFCIWELINGRLTGKDILNNIIERFRIALEEAEADLVEFLRQLETIKAIV